MSHYTISIQTEPYFSSIQHHPSSGQHILAHFTDSSIVVYQAYNPRIAEFAVREQMLGGSEFSYNRMSWIKPNFLWMMYRCGWADKEDQERVLAIWLKKLDFEQILSAAVFSSFTPGKHETYDAWRKDLEEKDIRLQWDPDHDPFGGKLKRRAIQLGLKGAALQHFGKEKIEHIEDITDFVKAQREYVKNGSLDHLQVPVERIYKPLDKSITEIIDIANHDD